MRHQERLADPFAHRATVRELLPQRERPRQVPEPRYLLKPMPFATFGELAALGLVLEVWCSTCKGSRPVMIGEALAARRFGHARFTRSAHQYDGVVCGGLGHRGHETSYTGTHRPSSRERHSQRALHWQQRRPTRGEAIHALGGCYVASLGFGP